MSDWALGACQWPARTFPQVDHSLLDRRAAHPRMPASGNPDPASDFPTDPVRCQGGVPGTSLTGGLGQVIVADQKAPCRHEWKEDIDDDVGGAGRADERRPEKGCRDHNQFGEVAMNRFNVPIRPPLPIGK